MLSAARESNARMREGSRSKSRKLDAHTNRNCCEKAEILFEDYAMTAIFINVTFKPARCEPNERRTRASEAFAAIRQDAQPVALILPSLPWALQHLLRYLACGHPFWTEDFAIQSWPRIRGAIMRSVASCQGDINE